MALVATKFGVAPELQLNPHHQLMPLARPMDSGSSAVAEFLWAVLARPVNVSVGWPECRSLQEVGETRRARVGVSCSGSRVAPRGAEDQRPDRGPAGAGRRWRRQARSSGPPARVCTATARSTRGWTWRTGGVLDVQATQVGTPAPLQAGLTLAGPPQLQRLLRPRRRLGWVLDVHADDRPLHGQRCRLAGPPRVSDQAWRRPCQTS